jgi:hypothetical protein
MRTNSGFDRLLEAGQPFDDICTNMHPNDPSLATGQALHIAKRLRGF